MRCNSLAVLLICVCFFSGVLVSASPVAVHHQEGLLHGFLSLSSLDGKLIAEGDVTQNAHGSQITNHTIFHFKDGSLQDETAIFSQNHYFRLISYHLVQKGPAFQRAVDTSIVVSTGQVTVRYTDDDGKEKTATDRMKLPPDVANGLVPILAQNLQENAPQTEVSMVVATPKPRLIKLAISRQGTEAFTVGASSRKAIHYVVKFEIGGVAGVVAPLVGKQPPDSHIWVLGGEAPVVVKSESISSMGGPVWRTELLSPTWPKNTAAESKTRAESKDSSAGAR